MKLKKLIPENNFRKAKIPELSLGDFLYDLTHYVISLLQK